MGHSSFTIRTQFNSSACYVAFPRFQYSRNSTRFRPDDGIFVSPISSRLSITTHRLSVRTQNKSCRPERRRIPSLLHPRSLRLDTTQRLDLALHSQLPMRATYRISILTTSTSLQSKSCTNMQSQFDSCRTTFHLLKFAFDQNNRLS